MNDVNNVNNIENESRSFDQIRISDPVKNTGYSTPISKTPPSIENQIDKRLTAIHQNSLTSSNSSIESSTPSGATEIVEFIGDDWLQFSSVELNVSRKNIASNSEEPAIGNFDEITKSKLEFRDYIADLSLQKDIESSIIEETVSQEINNTKISNENESKNSDYVPSSSISTINRTKSDVSDSLNLPINNDAFPVDIREIYVPASKNECRLFTQTIFLPVL